MLGLDFETYSEVDIRVHGLDRYVNHHSFRVLLASVADGAQSPRRYDFVTSVGGGQDQVLAAFWEILKRNGSTVVAHNASFERAVLKRMGITEVAVLDSAVIARIQGAASKLEAAGPQLVGSQKLASGQALIKKFCVPLADGTALVDHIKDWTKEDWEDWEQFGIYCDKDAEISRDIHARFGDVISEKEWRNELATQAMNDAGWYVDLELVRAMEDQYERNLIELKDWFHAMHDPLRELNFNSPIQLARWCRERGVKVTSLDEQHLRTYLKQVEQRIVAVQKDPDRWLRPGQPSLLQLEVVRDMLQTKQELGGSSLTKLRVIQNQVGYDGRLRGQYMHVGAGQTWRTSGRGVQMQNLKRLGPEPDDVTTLLEGTEAWDNQRLARNLRQAFRAEHPEGRLIVGDFSAVESRGLAFLADETWKLDGYRQGKDMYKALASKMLGTPYESIDKAQRQQGKVGELSCGYGAGGGAVLTFAQKMGMDLDADDAAAIVKDWREANPQIVGFWALLDHALHEVVEHGRSEYQFRAGVVEQLVVEICQIFTPGSITREHPKARSIELRLWGSNRQLIVRRVFHGAHMQGRDVCYLKPSELQSGNLWRARWSKNGQSGPYKLYGGKLTGILTQSFCREIFFHAVRRASTHLTTPNTRVIGQFHDEIVVEWEPGDISLDTAITELSSIMSGTRLVQGFPLAAEVKDAHRYIK